jgi:F1F0 ATPase subunit 2
MSDLGLLIAALVAGLVLGAAFFGGLWWTVNRALTATVPSMWFGVSALLRTSLSVAALYCIARSGLPSLLTCLCGFLIARGAVKHLTRIAC